MIKHEEFKNIVLRNIVLNLKTEENEMGKLIGLSVNFSPLNENMIYHKSDGQPIPFLDKDLGIKLDIKSVIKLASLFLETQSSYLFNTRQKVFSKDLIETIKSSLDKTSLRVRVSKQFFREEERGRFKISIAIIRNDEEVVNLNFTKRDVLLFTSLIRKMLSSYHRGSFLTLDAYLVEKETEKELDSKIISISKVDNSLLIDNVWLHGQELLNLIFIIEQLIFKLNIEKNIESLHSSYRQVKLTNIKDVAYLDIKKLNAEHEEEPISDSYPDAFIRIPISSTILSYLYLFLDIDTLRHSDFTLDKTVEILNSQKALSDKKIRFHISLKESSLGIGVAQKSKNPDESKISLIGKTKPGKYKVLNELDDELDGYIKIYDKDNNMTLIPLLEEFDIDLKDQYPKLISALSIAFTKEYLTEEKDYNFNKFFVVNISPQGAFKYVIAIHADNKNKAPAVLIIDKYRIKKGEEDKHLSRYRQPLFKRYVFQLLAILLTSSEDIFNLDLIEDKKIKSILKYQYKSFKKINQLKKDKDVKYGIKKTNDGVLIGNFTQKNTSSLLGYQDVALLNISSYFRLITGIWVPFVGDKIAIGQDGYLTDMYGEINMEENGAKWATKIFFCTSF